MTDNWYKKSPSILTALLLILTFSACMSQPVLETAPAEEISMPEEVMDGEKESVPEIKSMNDIPSWVLDSTPKDGHPRFVVFVSRRADRDEESEKAHQLAAMEASKYQGIYVSVKELTQKGNTNFGYINDLQVQYNEAAAPQYLDDLELENELRTPEGTFARYIFTGATTDLTYELPTGYPPEWTVNAPQIPGYIIATGFVERHRNWAQSIKAADESAIAQLAYIIYGKVSNQVETIDKSTSTRGSTGVLGTIYIEGEGIIRNMLVLARWKDSDNNYYSLAAIPNN